MIARLKQYVAIVRSSRNIARLYSGEFSEKEERQLGDWRSDSPEYKERFADTMNLMSEMETLADDPELLAMLNKRPEKESERPHRHQWPTFAVAAGLVLAVLVGVMNWSQPPAQRADIDRYLTRIGEQKTVTLDDGSIINLNTATELLVEYTDTERRLTLERGEAYFDVAKDGRPFTVAVGDKAISALGTQFNIFRSPEQFTLAVTEGVVSIHQRHEKIDLDSPVLSPKNGEVLTFGAGGQHRAKAGVFAAFDIANQELTVSFDPNINRSHIWRKGIIRFDAVPLSEVVKQLNRYAAKKILIEDRSVMDMELYATVRVDRIRMALSVLEQTLPIRVVHHFDKVVLKSAD